MAKLSTGSSPRMRGTPSLGDVVLPVVGIIPAYAGNTLAFFHCCSILWDHPRVCGEHYAIHDYLSVNEGSSPRMRGTHEQYRNVFDYNGIIPAYAGNTCYSMCR